MAALKRKSVGRSPRNSDSAASDCDHRSRLQVGTAILDDVGHRGNAPLCGDVRQAHQPCVRQIMHPDQLAEVGVDRHHDSVQRLSQLQQSAVARIRTECASLQGVVARAAKPFGKAAAGAAINQKIHDPATETVASVSPAITACA